MSHVCETGLDEGVVVCVGRVGKVGEERLGEGTWCDAGEVELVSRRVDLDVAVVECLCDDVVDVGHGRVHVAPTEVLQRPVLADGGDDRVVGQVSVVGGVLRRGGDDAAEQNRGDTVGVAVALVLVKGDLDQGPVVVEASVVEERSQEVLGPVGEE